MRIVLKIRLEYFLASLDSIETKQEYDMQRRELTQILYFSTAIWEPTRLNRLNHKSENLTSDATNLDQ